jgi:hypothetical protein
MNGQEYAQTSGGTFENRVAKTFEIKQGLQPANITVTYEVLLLNIIGFTQNVTISFNPAFFERNIIGSNGSLILVPDITDSSITYNNWISEYCSRRVRGTPPEESIVNQKIAGFIKWYMYGNYSAGTYTYELPTLANDSMKILFDGGQFHLKEISSVTGSGITPLLSTASVMDSANTSVGVLDPNIPVYFSNISSDLDPNDPKFHPMFSNYFTSNNLVTGYMINPGQKFGENGTTCFSFIIFLNDDQAEFDNRELRLGGSLKEAVKYIRTGQRDQNYNTAIDIITAYVNAYPQKMARWYFGQIDKKSKSTNNDYYSACGVSGAGVSYLGQIFSRLDKIIRFKQGANLIPQIQDELNDLKKLPTRTAIPISDARILNIFLNPATGSIDPTSILPKIPQLYALMADYKRQGDYNQIHEVLSCILQNGKNDQMFTFASGDELAALISRLCGIPTILQWSGGGRTTLYRCDIFSNDAGERERLTITSNNNIINNFKANVIPDLEKITDFLEKIFPSLGIICDQFHQIFTQIPTTDNIGYLSKFELLSKIINIYILFTKANEFTEDGLLQKLGKFITTYEKYNVIVFNPPSNTVLLAKSREVLDSITAISNDPAMTLYDDIVQQFPIIQTVDNIEDIVNYFTPLNVTTELRTGTFERKIFNLKFVNGLTKNKKLVALSGQLRILYSDTVSRSGRASNSKRPKDASQVKQSTKKYNELINEFPSPFQVYLVESLGEESPATGLFPSTLADIGGSFFPQNYIPLTPQIVNNDTGQVTTGTPIQIILQNIVPQLKSSIAKIQGSPPAGGKKKKYNLNFQKGGNYYSTLRSINANKRYCYNKIQSYVLKIFSKCNKFLLDTFNNVIREPDAAGNPTVILNSLAQLLTVPEDGSGSVFQAIYNTDSSLNQQPLFNYLSTYITNFIMPNWNTIQDVKMVYIRILYYLAKYSDINDFFTNLLFNVGEDPENNGLYIQIQELSLQYTAGMIEDGGDINQQLTMSDFLKKLNLSYVRDLIMMLSIQIPDNMNMPDGTQYNSIFMDITGVVEDDTTVNTSFLPTQYQTLLQPNISSTSVLLLTLGIMNILYEGQYEPQFNTTALDAIWPIIYSSDQSNRDLIDWFRSRPSALAFFGVGVGDTYFGSAATGSHRSVNVVQEYIMQRVMEVTDVPFAGARGIRINEIWRGGKKTKKRKNKKHNKTKNKNKNYKKDKKSKIKKIKKIKKINTKKNI